MFKNVTVAFQLPIFLTACLPACLFISVYSCHHFPRNPYHVEDVYIIKVIIFHFDEIFAVTIC
jgi:hypothetical protein